MIVIVDFSCHAFSNPRDMFTLLVSSPWGIIILQLFPWGSFLQNHQETFCCSLLSSYFIFATIKSKGSEHTLSQQFSTYVSSLHLKLNIITQQ